MSLQKQIEELQRLERELRDDKNIQARVTTVGAFATLADFKRRIFVEGKDASEGKIGNYDTKPFYAGKSNLQGLPKGKFDNKGKFGDRVFKNGKKHRSTYLKGGYREFRSRTGRQNSKVDLNLTGASAQTIQVGTKSGLVVIGFTNQQRLIILEANEKRFRKNIFTLSQSEQETYQNTVEREFQEIIREILQTA